MPAAPVAGPSVRRTELPIRGLENYIGLRLIHLAGIVILVIGISIGVKYAIDRNLISEGARILLAYSSGLLLFVLAWRSRARYASFSAVLFSGAMASLYFTTYAAYVYYGLLPSVAAFILMVILTISTALKALDYNRQEIALLGLVGAYGIPFLISSNSDQAGLFFLYITIINTGVVFLALKKEWLLVMRIAQVITWILFIGWSANRQTPGDAGMGLLFLSLFFLLFSLSALAPALKNRRPLPSAHAYLLLFNNISVYISALMLFAFSFTNEELASVSGICALFLALQTALYFFLLPQEDFVRQVHGAFALLLLMIFIAAEWEGFAVTLLWLCMAVILFVWGVYVKSRVLRVSSMVLIGLTLLKLVALDSLRFTTIEKIIAYITLGVLMLVVSFFYQKYKAKLFE